MAAGACGDGRRQVPIQVDVARSRYVPPGISLPSRLRVHQIVAAVQDGDMGRVQQAPQRGDIDQGAVFHESQLIAAATEPHPLQSDHGTHSILGQRQSVLVARAARAGAQGAAVRVAAAALRQAGTPVAPNAEAQSARPRARAQGRRLRGVRIGRGAVLPGREVPPGADFRHQPRGSRGHHAGHLRIPGVRGTLADPHHRCDIFRRSRRTHRRTHGCHARRGRAKPAPSRDA